MLPVERAVPQLFMVLIQYAAESDKFEGEIGAELAFQVQLACRRWVRGGLKSVGPQRLQEVR